MEPNEFTVEDLEQVFSSKPRYGRNRPKKSYVKSESIHSKSTELEESGQSGSKEVIVDENEPPQGESTPITSFEHRMKKISQESLDSLYDEINKIHDSMERDNDPESVFKKPGKDFSFQVEPSKSTKELMARKFANKAAQETKEGDKQAEPVAKGRGRKKTKPTSTDDNKEVAAINNATSRTKSRTKSRTTNKSTPNEIAANELDNDLDVEIYQPKFVICQVHTKHGSYTIRKYQELTPQQRKQMSHCQLNVLFGLDPFNLLHPK